MSLKKNSISIFIGILLLLPISCLQESGLMTGNHNSGNTLSSLNNSKPINRDLVIPGRIIVQYQSEDFQRNGVSLHGVSGLRGMDSVDITSVKRLFSDKTINTLKTRGAIHLNNSTIMSQLVAITIDSQDVDETIAVIKQIEKDPNVLFAEPDYSMKLQLTTNDPMIGQLWGLEKIQAYQAWDVIIGSEDVIVAVIDTGIDYTHPDLTDAVLKDSNGNIIGYNFFDNNSDVMDTYGHGTIVSGSIAASGNNNEGIAGVAWNTKIMPIKGFKNKDDYNAANLETKVSIIVKSIDFAIANGAHIINNSYGDYFTKDEAPVSIAMAIERAKDAGILFVCAAGNDSSDNDVRTFYPSGYEIDNVVSVAASSENDKLASFSNYGKKTVHIAAPGNKITTTALGGGYNDYNGTSLAAPYVCGVAALLKSKYPDWDYKNIKDRIFATSDKVLTDDRCVLEKLYFWSVETRCKLSTGGRINAFKAVGGSTECNLSVKPPLHNTDVKGIVPIKIDYNCDFEKIEIIINGSLVQSSIEVPFTYNWNTLEYGNGEATILIKLYTTDGKIVDSISTVTIDNSPCTEWTETNAVHVAEGRAESYTKWWYLQYAKTVGGGDDLGMYGNAWWSPVTTVHEETPGMYKAGSCK